MRLLPVAYNEAAEIYDVEEELRSAGETEKADTFRDVRVGLYELVVECRERNNRLIESTMLNRKERRMLRERYFFAHSWSQLFKNFGYSVDHCKRIHRDAVAKVERDHQSEDFKTLYEQERHRLDELVARVGEKLR
jgi:hypothetical protein